VLPVSYSMPNGETGRFTYYDDGYAGPAATGDPTSALSPLAGGLGDLTDGTIATANWNVTPALYVGWSSITPTITFFFDQVYDFTALTLYADDSNQLGGVSTPGRAIVNGTSYQVADGASGAPIVSMFDLTGLTTDEIVLTVEDGAASWVMLSEVTFDGAPSTGIAPVPLPAGLPLLAAGLGALALLRRRR
jgi:hypothetical protein